MITALSIIIVILVAVIAFLLKLYSATEDARVRHLNTIITNIDAEFYAARDKLVGADNPGMECPFSALAYQNLLWIYRDEIDAMRDEIHAKYRYTYGEL